MPEGDTIHRAAATLDRALSGSQVVDFRTVLPQLSRVDDDAPIVGRTIEKVSAVGKHLLIHFSGDLVLRTHMRMHGSWHIYRRGERWRRSATDMRIVIATDAFEAIGFQIPIAEFVRGGALMKNRELRRLGPDVLAPDFDPSTAVDRLVEHPGDEIANALLNQTVVCGIGNVFKSEILWVRKISPFRLVREIPREELEQILVEAAKELRDNVVDGIGGSRRTTRRLSPADRLFVYGRGGEPCRRCGNRIEWGKQGRDARSTYWCPVCQK